VDQGARFTITVRGRAVADVVPSRRRDQQRVKEAVEALRRFPRITGVSGNAVLGWIREGRK
jgi:antitoxin (DNA-binding transcriptional repressor) of toxin-antitoxin stability system